ncbi:MAG: macro domain-containing protein [Chloroflexi bacterium]|nr:macro domain-containing protein [Chloroflexota bacterium]
MVEIVKGDILESDAQTLVNTVNCVGVMGKGIALEFKNRFPDMYQDYVARCARGEVRPGRPYLYRGLFKWILNFPTKRHWRSVSRLEDIVRGLDYLRDHYREWGITSLAVPPLGCGNGQLDWRIVGPVLYQHLQRLDIPVTLYAPFEAATEETDAAYLQRIPGDRVDLGLATSRLDSALVGLAEIVARIHREPYHAQLGRVMFQKIAYFATEAGLPTGFRYEPGSFGPFSRDVRPALTRLVNHGVMREEQRGGTFAVEPGPEYGEAMRMLGAQVEEWEPVIERVVDLFLRMRRSRQAEIAATVHFAVRLLEEKLGRAPSERELFDAVQEWKKGRRPPLGDEEIAEAIRSLNMLGWLQVSPSEDLPLEEDELLYA